MYSVSNLNVQVSTATKTWPYTKPGNKDIVVQRMEI